jgi:hypothetical protein
VVQAGVNSFGEAPANTYLFGMPVAGASWRVVIPGPARAPANADIDISKVEDIVIKVQHKALPAQSSPGSIDLSCLGFGT